MRPRDKMLGWIEKGQKINRQAQLHEGNGLAADAQKKRRDAWERGKAKKSEEQLCNQYEAASEANCEDTQPKKKEAPEQPEMGKGHKMKKWAKRSRKIRKHATMGNSVSGNAEGGTAT